MVEVVCQICKRKDIAPQPISKFVCDDCYHFLLDNPPENDEDNWSKKVHTYVTIAEYQKGRDKLTIEFSTSHNGFTVHWHDDFLDVYPNFRDAERRVRTAMKMMAEDNWSDRNE